MIRTLVVEDDPVILDINSSYVEQVAGFVVVGLARSGGEAIAAAKDQPVDLIMLDFYLPDMSGLDVCRALRAAHTPPIDIIAVTAARDGATVRAAIAQGAVQYLIKPYTRASFREKLKQYAAYHQGLPSDDEIISQPELDQTLNTLHPSSNTVLPKGLAPHTYGLIIGVLRKADQPLTVTEIAQATGEPMAGRTACRYLDHLHQQGLVVLTSRYGTTGRPKHLYRWAELTDPR